MILGYVTVGLRAPPLSREIYAQKISLEVTPFSPAATFTYCLYTHPFGSRLGNPILGTRPMPPSIKLG